MTALTVSVVAHNQRSDLERLLPSLLAATSKLDAEVLIVENRSTDGSAELLAGIGGIEVIPNPARTGYGSNHNLSIRRAKGEYIAIMNADMTVDADVFVRLKAFMDANPDVGIVTPKILNEDGTVQGLNKRLPTLWDLFLRRFAPRFVQRRFQRRLDYYEMRDVGYDAVCDVPFISGAFMFARTRLLRDLGGFDERYFLYFEDVDLCRRVARTHRTAYFPGATVVHAWKRASHTRPRFLWYFIGSAAKYFLRWGIRIS